MTPGTPTRMAAWLESAWLARYLERQLDGEELAWFEAYLLDKPELLDMVEADNSLRDTLASSSAAEIAAPMTPRARRPSWTGISLAAGLCAGIGVGWLAGFGRPVAETSPAIIASPTRIIFDTQRGIAAMPTIEHADSTGAYELLEIAVPPDAAKVVVLLADGSQHALSVSPDGFVSFLISKLSVAQSMPATLSYELSGKNVKRYIKIPTAKSGESR